MNIRAPRGGEFTHSDLFLRDAPTAEIGLELARAELPSLILMDINLPGMDGYAALKQLQADPRTAHIPVIAMSANAMKKDLSKGHDAGFIDYITKPIDVQKFMTLLDRHLSDHPKASP